MAVNRLVMNSVMNTHHFKDITFRFAPGSEIVDLLEPTQPAVSFGGTERPMDGGHTHASPDGHAHHHAITTRTHTKDIATTALPQLRPRSIP